MIVNHLLQTSSVQINIKLCFNFNLTKYENVAHSLICYEIWTKSKKKNTNIDLFLSSDTQSSTCIHSSSFTLLAVLLLCFACISLYFLMIEQFTSCISWEDSFMQKTSKQFIDDKRWIIRRVRSLLNFLAIFCSSSFICTSWLHFNALNIDLSYDSTFSELLDFRMCSFFHSSECFKIFT